MSIAVAHLDGFTPHLGLSRLGSRPHLGPTPGITRAQLSPPGDCEVKPGVWTTPPRARSTVHIAPFAVKWHAPTPISRWAVAQRQDGARQAAKGFFSIQV